MGAVNQETIEKSVKAMIVNLHQAVMVTKKLNKYDAAKKVMHFLMEDIVKDTLKFPTPQEAMGKHLRSLIQDYVEEYKDKKDKAYTALLRLEEMLS